MQNSPKMGETFDHCLYFSLSRLQRSINRLAEDAFSPTGLAPGHAYLLMALAEQESLSNGALAEVMGLAPSTVTRFVDKLIKAGLARRFRKGRESRTAITDTGKAKMTQIRACWQGLYHGYNLIYGREEVKELNDKIVAFNHTVSYMG